jgi:hypothetical protein
MMETPKPILVAGMMWTLITTTQQINFVRGK